MAKYKIIPSSRTIVQSPISIGHKAEKGVEAIEFDLTAWVETYGSGTLTVIMRRWGDAIPYPIALEIDENNKATWTLSDTDTARAGMAYAQLSYIVGETVVKKSDIYTFRVMDSLTGEGEPPEAYESWLEHLTHLAAEAMAEVLDIEGVATDKTLTVDGGVADAKATGEALAEKVDAADYNELSARVGANTIALAEKADRSTTYTKTEVDQMIEDVEVETDTTLEIAGAPADAKKVGDELSDIKADLGAQTGIISKTSDHYINLTTDPVDISNPSTSSTGLTYAVVDCSEGDKFVINAVGATSGRAWGFLDSSNHVLSMADANATVTDLELTAPTNAVKLIINDKGDGMSYKVGNNLVSRVSEIEKGGYLLSDDVKAAILACFDYVAWKGTNGNSPYDMLYTALYPNAYPTVKWDMSVGRLPSAEDGIDTVSNSENVFASFNALSGIYIDHNNSALDSQYVRFEPTNFNTCKRCVFETSINIVEITDPGDLDIRLSDGSGGLRVMILPNASVGRTMAIYDGDTRVILPEITINTGVTYKIKCEFNQNGENRVYINDILVFAGSEVSTSYTSANRFYLAGKVKCYIQSMKWTFKEI